MSQCKQTGKTGVKPDVEVQGISHKATLWLNKSSGENKKKKYRKAPQQLIERKPQKGNWRNEEKVKKWKEWKKQIGLFL